jgi:hypothetical protein
MKEEQEQALQAFGGGNSEYKGTSWYGNALDVLKDISQANLAGVEWTNRKQSHPLRMRMTKVVLEV